MPGERVEWLVLENRFSFDGGRRRVGGHADGVRHPAVRRRNNADLHPLRLVEDHECYGVCVQGWDFYLGQSLRELVETGSGRPNTFDHRARDHVAAVRG